MSRAGDNLQDAIRELLEEEIGNCIDTDEIADAAAEKVAENLDLSSEIEEAVENKMEDIDIDSHLSEILDIKLDERIREEIIGHLDHICGEVMAKIRLDLAQMVGESVASHVKEALSNLTFNIVVQPAVKP